MYLQIIYYEIKISNCGMIQRKRDKSHFKHVDILSRNELKALCFFPQLIQVFIRLSYQIRLTMKASRSIMHHAS